MDTGTVCFLQPDLNKIPVGWEFKKKVYHDMLACPKIDEGICPAVGSPPIAIGITTASMQFPYTTYEGKTQTGYLSLYPAFSAYPKWDMRLSLIIGNGMALDGLSSSVAIPFDSLDTFMDKLLQRIYTYRAPELDGLPIACYRGQHSFQDKDREQPYDLCSNGGYFSYRDDETRH